MGQLHSVHSKANSLAFSEAIITYSKQLWTKDSMMVYNLLRLAACPSVEAISPLSIKTRSAELKSIVKPTLSPKDPNFAEWYKGYEAEMKKKSEGQEPADN